MTVPFHFRRWTFFACFCILSKEVTEVSSRQRWQFPKFNLNQDENNQHMDDSEKMSALWYEQAVTGLMAVIGTRLQQDLSKDSIGNTQLEKCASTAENSVQYAQCLAPVIRQKRLVQQWRKHREYRKKTQEGQRRMRYSRAAYESSFGSFVVEQPQPNGAPVATGQADIFARQQFPQQQQQPVFLQQDSQQAFPQQQQQPVFPQQENVQQQERQSFQGVPGQSYQGEQGAPQTFFQQGNPLPQQGIFDPQAFFPRALTTQTLVPTTEKPLLVEIADWLTGAVQYAKQNVPPPQRVGIRQNANGGNTFFGQKDNKREYTEEFSAKDDAFDSSPVEAFSKKLFAPALFGNSTGPSGWSTKHLASQGLLSNITSSLDSFLKTHGFDPHDPHGAVANEIVPMWQLEFLEDVHQLVIQVTKQAEQQAQQQQLQQQQPPSNHAVKILSPRLLPLDDDSAQYDAKFLSPDILSFADEGLAPLPSMLGATVGEASKEAWLRFIMEASGAKDMIGGDPKLLDMIVKSDKALAESGNDQPQPSFSNLYGQVFDKFEQTFQKFYKTFTTEQIGRMESKGYAYMSRDQIDYMYHSDESPCADQKNCTDRWDLDKYEKLSDAERDEAMLDFILELANSGEAHSEPWTSQTDEGAKRRSKRTLLLTPVKFMPLIRMSSVISMPIILSPIMFSPIILSPSLLGPIILSPAIFSPVILSPLVLGALVLSPFVGNPVILSPLVLFPIILSPLVLNPFILCPYVLTPLILSPLVLSPAILDPNVLSPLILDPGVLSPIILSPHALSPIILSPQAVSALILSPGVLSPIIRSPVAVFAIILSPNIMG